MTLIHGLSQLLEKAEGWGRVLLLLQIVEEVSRVSIGGVDWVVEATDDRTW